MLEEGTLILPGNNAKPSSNSSMRRDFNDGIKKMIEEIKPFSSFLEDNQKDGDVAFEQEELDSSEEEEKEKQDGSG